MSFETKILVGTGPGNLQVHPCPALQEICVVWFAGGYECSRQWCRTGTGAKILPRDVPVPVWVGDRSVTDVTCDCFRHSRSSLPPCHHLKFDGEGQDDEGR